MKKFYANFLCLNLVLLFHFTNGGLAEGKGTIGENSKKILDYMHQLNHPEEDTNGRGLYPELNNIEREETENQLQTFAGPSHLPHFTAGCLPGRIRTEDGRCVVPF